jgi:biopolymer transport protein TolR
MSGDSGNDLKSEINVTPLVDVMLVLLVVFMITAPMLNTGVDIDLPSVDAPALDDQEGKLILSIDQNRKLYMGATPISWKELGDKLATNERIKREGALYVEADKNLPYGIVITAMAAARQAGVMKVQMLTDPAEQLDLGELDRQSQGAPALPPVQ